MGGVAHWAGDVLYEVYVRSFRDDDGDGVGDLPGLLGRLDYLTALGVDALWLSPIHPSPDADTGYDVADYTAVDPRLGDLADVDRLLEAAHRPGLRVLLDLVLNHTSDRHPWFRASRSARDDPQRDWYLWRPGPAGVPPTNWRSVTGGSAWAYDATTDEHYLHTFLPEQPDLNWRTPALQSAVADVMRFWLARGVDGFRLDALPVLVKDDQLRDNPADPAWRSGAADYTRLLPTYTVDRPEMSEVLSFLRGVVDEFPGRVLAAELGLPPHRAARYHATIDVPFNFGLITRPWTAPRLHRRIAAHLDALPAGAAPNWVLGNHDVRRLATRLGAALSRVAAVLALSLPGTVTLYYGDELGLPDNPVTPDVPRDGFARRRPGWSRDPARAPMPWDATEHGGFSAGDPWLPAYPDAAERSVAAQLADPRSSLALYRRLLQVRRGAGLGAGRSVEALASTESELSFDRTVGARRFRFVARLDGGRGDVPLPGPGRPLVTACDPAPDPRPVSAVSLAGPDAALVELLP